MTIRVVQWTTGNVGKQSVEAVMKRPDLELVGCYAWSKEKSGQDIGELCGLPPIGLMATHDVDALLALKPDCVIYNPMWFNVDEMVRILESGANIVATAAFINGQSYPDDGRQRMLDACAKGGSSMFGSGVSPGYIELVAVALGQCLGPHRPRADQRGGRHHGLRLASDRDSGGIRPTARRPGLARA